MTHEVRRPLAVTAHPSENFGPRRGEAGVELVVIHYTAMRSTHDALARLCDPQFEVSAHYVIAETGQVFHLVAEEARAWHAGAGAWAGITDINSHSIGIELANDGQSPFAAAQMDALTILLDDLFTRHHLAPHQVIGHADMAPARKIDPGPRFDWARLGKLGFATFVKEYAPVECNEARFLSDLSAFGYPEAPLDALLSAFRARFRQGAHGPLCADDCGVARALYAQLDVDPNPTIS